MPPCKLSLRAIRKASSGVQCINFPRLETPFGWNNFVERLLDTPQNKKPLARCGHADIMELLRQQAREQFKSDSGRLQEAVAEVRVIANAANTHHSLTW
jgi:hypothetical protein